MSKHDVLKAIDQNRLTLYLQPVVSTVSHRPVFYEALLRLTGMSGDVVTAADFIEHAETQNVILDVDQRTLELAIVLLETYPAFDLSLNISSLTTADFAWVRTLDQLTSDRRGLTNRMIIEVTETAAIADINRTLAFIDSLRDHGCRIAIDDFGAGHTNFTNLHLISPHIVKIDKSFVSTYEQSNSRAFLSAVVDLSKSLGFETVAEGVETEACMEEMTKLGVTYLQGFLFGEPALPQDAFSQQAEQD